MVAATRSRRFNFLVIMLMMALTVSEKYWGEGFSFG